MVFCFGCSLGCSLGCPLGCSLGCSLGCPLGCSLGCSLGYSFGAHGPFMHDPASHSAPIKKIIAPMVAIFYQNPTHPTHGILVNGWCCIQIKIERPINTGSFKDQHLKRSIRIEEPNNPATTNRPYNKICPAIWAGIHLQASNARTNLVLN